MKKIKKPIEVLKNMKDFRRNSDCGILLSDADIILTLCKYGMTWEESEKFFKENYNIV